MSTTNYMFRLRLNDKTFYGAIRNWRDFFPTIRLNERYRTRLPVFSFDQVRFTKGAKTYIDEQRDLRGPLTDISVDVDLFNVSTFSWDGYISGRLAFDRYKKRATETLVGIDPEGFIVKWLNRDETPLELTALKDMDGAAIAPFSTELQEITLSAQIINLYFEAESLNESTKNSTGLGSTAGWTKNFRLSGLTSIKDEIPDETHTLSCGWEDNPSQFLDLKDSVDYVYGIEYNVGYGLSIDWDTAAAASSTLKVELILDHYDYFTGEWLGTVLESNEETSSSTPITLAGNFTGVSDTYRRSGGTDPNNPADFDKIRAYIRVSFTDTGSNFEYNLDMQANAFRVVAAKESTYPDTQCQGILVYEAALRMLQKMTGLNDPLRSPLLGRTDSEVHQYAQDGAASLYLYTNGRLVRQFPEDEYPLTGQFYELFKAINADWNIGIGVITENDTRYIAIDAIEEFWKKDNVAFVINDPKDLEEETALEYLFSELRFGNDKYEKEERGTLATPHTPRVYSTDLGSVVKKFYEFKQPAITSSPLIERLRRDPYEEGVEKDNEHDLAIVLIELKRSGGGYVRTTGNDLESVANINNPETHYNLGITPGRALRRHAKWWKGGLQQKSIQDSDQFVRFQSGAGNLAAQTQKDGVLVSESEDIQIQTLNTPLVRPNRGMFKYPLTREQMISLASDPNQSIVVNYRGKAYTFFIEETSIENFDSKNADFKLIESNQPAII